MRESLLPEARWFGFVGQSVAYGRVQHFLERLASLTHGAAQEFLHVGIERYGRSHYRIMTAINMLSRCHVRKLADLYFRRDLWIHQ